MSIVFKPTGSLDIATEATDLPEQAAGNSSFSNAQSRCKNLDIDQEGKAITRNGSTRPTSNTLEAQSNFIIEQSGNRYAFAGTQIYKDESSIATDLTDAQWSAIKYNAFNDTTQRVFCLNGTDRKKINDTTVEEWGLEAPTVTPTAEAGATTGLTGDYKVKYTYAVKSGTTVISESNPSPASASVTLSNESLNMYTNYSGIPQDSQVTHVRFYRTLAGGDIYYHDQDVVVSAPFDFLGIVVDSTTADTALGSEVATDHDRPPLGSIVIGPLYNGLCFIAKDNLLYWCKAKRPEYWPVNNFIEVGPPQFPIKSMVVFDGQLYILTKNLIWWIQGNTSGAFKAVPLESLAGAPNIFGAVAIKGRGVYHLGVDGIYLYSGGVDRKISEANLEPIFPDAGGNAGTPTNGIEAVESDESTQWLARSQNKIYFHWRDGNVIATNLDNGKTRYFKYDQRLSSPALDKTNDRFLVGDSDKYIRQIEDPLADDDVGTSIDWETQSKDFTLQTRKHFPRWAKYDVNVDDATTVEGKIILDGSVHHTHSITESRKTRRRLVDANNGNRLAVRISGTGKAEIYAAEIE